MSRFPSRELAKRPAKGGDGKSGPAVATRCAHHPYGGFLAPQRRASRGPPRQGGCHAAEVQPREERAPVRGPQGQGNVEGASGEDRELAGRVEARWREVTLGQWEVEPGW